MLGRRLEGFEYGRQQVLYHDVTLLLHRGDQHQPRAAAVEISDGEDQRQADGFELGNLPNDFPNGNVEGFCTWSGGL